MAKAPREEAQERRAASREQRRSGVSQPLEDGENGAAEGGENGTDTMTSAKRAARTAAGASIAGGLAGAEKALLDRRVQPEDEDAHDESEPEPMDESEEVAGEDGSEPAQAADVPDSPAEATQASTREREDGEGEAESRDVDEPQRGASSSDVAGLVKRAREQISDVLGKEPESISGIRNVDGVWSVTVEVVEIHRIPDTTDILSSYEVVLDDDGDLVRLDRQRRYRRSQVEEDR